MSNKKYIKYILLIIFILLAYLVYNNRSKLYELYQDKNNNYTELVLITSVINTETIPGTFNYSSTRSTFTQEERFNQTKQSIQTVYDKIPNAYIVFVECIDLKSEYESYIKNNVNMYKNFYNNEDVRANVQSIYKAKGEISQHNAFIEYCLPEINKLNFNIKRLWKLSGRYYLNDNFDINNYSFDSITVSKKDSDTNFSTVFFSWPYKNIDSYISLVKTIYTKKFSKETSGLEQLFKQYTINNNFVYLEKLGVSGYVSVDKNNLYEAFQNNRDTVTLFLTSCGRPDLLRETLESFIKFNTYPIEEAIIMEDSGEKGINDFVKELLPFPTTILYNETRMGQMKSINNGIPYLKTPYVFHCEEDWEFYDYGFIEKSLEILKKNNKITLVSLRAHDEIRERYPEIPFHKVEGDNYYLVGPHIGNFSFNPGLRTLEVAKMFSPYKEGVCEGTLSDAFRNIGMTVALTENTKGYVRHLGWERHVY